MPGMPNKQNASYEEWSIWFERYLGFIREEVVLVGWSLGGMFLAKYVAEHRLPVKIRAMFLLAAPGGEYTDTSGTGEDCLDFLPPQDLSLVLEQVSHLEIWHSADDFVVPVTETAWYQNRLNDAKIRLFEDKNHFLNPELPELIDILQELP
jgi:predicted alpha/beta hydrolase family esterase